MKALMRNIQLVVSALEAERTGRPIAEHHLAPIANARQELALTKGVDVVAALHGLIHAGKPVQIDLEEIVYTSKAPPPESRRGHFAQRG